EASGWLVAIIPLIARTAERVFPPVAAGLSPTFFCESIGSTETPKRKRKTTYTKVLFVSIGISPPWVRTHPACLVRRRSFYRKRSSHEAGTQDACVPRVLALTQNFSKKRTQESVKTAFAKKRVQ